MEPPSPYRYLRPERLEDIAHPFADFADLKSPYLAGHSRRVAELAGRMARRLGLTSDEASTVRRAGFVHDVGLVTVPSYTLEKPQARLTEVEWERLRLHPYHAERILSGVPALKPVVPLVAAHHERPDGRGYYRGLAGSQIPLGARIIAVADSFDELTHDAADRAAVEPSAALARLRSEAGTGLSAEALDALGGELGAHGAEATGAGRNGRRRWPTGLSDREVEVMRLLAKGPPPGGGEALPQRAHGASPPGAHLRQARGEHQGGRPPVRDRAGPAGLTRSGPQGAAATEFRGTKWDVRPMPCGLGRQQDGPKGAAIAPGGHGGTGWRSKRATRRHPVVPRARAR
jgi:HD domain